MVKEIERTDIVCNRGSIIRIAEYVTENDFDKKYKILLINDSKEIVFAKNISKIDANFEFTWNDYAGQISRLTEQCRAYKEIIESFLSRLDVKINDSDVHIKHLGDIEVKDYNNGISKR